MKPVYIILLAASLNLIACSSMDSMEINNWVAQNKSRAGSRELNWSDYYKEIYRMAAQAEGLPGKKVIMESANTMYKAALTLEAGKLNPNEFDSMRGIADERIAEAGSSKEPASGGAGWGKGGATPAPAPY